MNLIQKLQENIFQKIANALVLNTLKKELPKAMKKVEDDPLLVSSLQNLEYHTEKLAEVLPDYCKRRPDSILCKDNKTVAGKVKPTGK
jgi:hypothetical protein